LEPRCSIDEKLGVVDVVFSTSSRRNSFVVTIVLVE